MRREVTEAENAANNAFEKRLRNLQEGERKCDEARPECGPCIRRGLECEGYTKPLRWVNDTTSVHSVDGPETSRPTDWGLDTSNVNTPPSSSYRVLNDQPQSRRLDDDHPLPPRPDEDGLDGLDNLFETCTFSTFLKPLKMSVSRAPSLTIAQF